MAPLTSESLQTLLDHSGTPGAMVSCYADLSMMPGQASPWRGQLKDSAQQIRTKLAHNDPARREFDDNLQTVSRVIEEQALHHRGSLAVFCANQRGFLRYFSLRPAVENGLVMHATPYVVPLLEVLLRHRDYLVVLMDTYHGLIWGFTPGAIPPERAATNGSVKCKQRSAAESWPREQTVAMRHREERILHFQKDLVREIERAWAGHAWDGIILLGYDDVREHLRKRLPATLADRVVAEVGYDWPGQSFPTQAELHSVLNQALWECDERLRQEMHERALTQRAIAIGPCATIDALQLGQVSSRGQGMLVVGADPRTTVGRCTRCHYLAYPARENCPRCQATCAPGNLWEEVLTFALRRQVHVTFLRGDEVLDQAGGLVALLPD